MKLEYKLRAWARNSGLTESKILYSVYRSINTIRFRKKFYEPINFRDIQVTIGDDHSLFPSVKAGDFEHLEFDYVQDRIGKGECVWDVGANVGIWSLVLSKLVGEDGSVHSFEPVDSTRSILFQNIGLNSAANVTVNGFALSDTDTVGYINIGVNAGCNTLVKGDDANQVGLEKQEVTCRSGDSYLTDTKSSPTFVKIDVEGWEPEVIAGMASVIKGLPMIMIEVSGKDSGTERNRIQQEMLNSLFQEYGKAKCFRSDAISTVTSLTISQIPKRESFNLIFENV
jgi:FkbM family methyltransferase